MNQIDFDTNKLKTNFCRDFIKSIEGKRQIIAYGYDISNEIIKKMKKTTKFVIPENGKIFDAGFKSINKENLRLPFDCVALEFFSTNKGVISKTIITANQNKDSIGAMAFCYIDDKSVNCPWCVCPVAVEIHHDKIIPIQLSNPKEVILTNGLRQNNDYNNKDSIEDAAGIAYCVLEFIEALSCKNVSIESHAHRKKGKSKLDALPFDDYKVLCVNVNKKYDSVGNEIKEQGTHRSPREHLRRGHIRRLHKGNVWVQSTVVNPGIGGRIEKDYRISA